jgi:hypothetical protein
MWIANGHTASEWNSLRLDSDTSEDWLTAIRIVDARFRERFIDAADVLIDLDDSLDARERRFGFAILALDCLVIETLQAFREGLVDARRSSQRLFCTFLEEQPEFRFSSKVARIFYRDFRCGILHQAETFNGSLCFSIGPMVVEKSDGLVINRTEVHRAIVKSFDRYLRQLADSANDVLRTNLRRKMANICRCDTTVP